MTNFACRQKFGRLFSMRKSIFNPENQQQDTASKIVAGLERISEAFKALLWEKAKVLGLSPIQIRILLFVAYHKDALCNVSHLAKEFNITKPTVSDAVRILANKELIVKDFSSSDSRSYTILLSEKGNDIVAQTENFADPLKKQFDGMPSKDLELLFQNISKVIYGLHRNNILSVQRTCYGCAFYDKRTSGDYCKLLETSLMPKDIRLDCPEFELKS